MNLLRDTWEAGTVGLCNRALCLPTSSVVSERLNWDFCGSGEWIFKVLDLEDSGFLGNFFQATKEDIEANPSQGHLYTITDRRNVAEYWNDVKRC